MLREDREFLCIYVKRRLIVLYCGNEKSSEGNTSQPGREKDSTNRTQLVKHIRAANHQTKFSFSFQQKCHSPTLLSRPLQIETSGASHPLAGPRLGHH